MEKKLFTIGYATKDIETFIALLKRNGINCLIDVRTSPYSKTFPNYDMPRLKETLKSENILYAHFGNEFGARRSEEDSYVTSYSLKGEKLEQVSFDNVYKLPAFVNGLSRVFKALEQGYRICFMCSEKYPVDCHRFWMVAYYFATLDEPFEIINIIDEDNSQTFEEVLNSSNYEKDREKFYKEHDELNSNSLVALPIDNWVIKWDELFSSNTSLIDKKHKYSNIKIGFSKGNDDYE